MKIKFLKLTALMLSSVAVIGCGAAMTCSAAVVTDGKAFYELGDTNKDKKVDVLDFIRVKRYLSDAAEEIEIFVSGGDFDSDGEISANDLTSMKKHLLGMESTDNNSSLWSEVIK